MLSPSTLPNGHGVFADSSPFSAPRRVAPRRFWSTRRLGFLSIGISLIAAIGIASTYRVFSQTYDEPAHIAAGMQWLSRGQFSYEAQHPPLARVMAAIGPYIAGDRTVGEPNEFHEGWRILGTGAHYRRTLALARLGELPFFLLMCLAVWAWGRRLFGDASATLSVLFVATNPNLLAHAGLATTDIAPAAMMVASLYAYARWAERRRIRDALILGVALGLSTVSKFSAIAFLGVTLVCAESWLVWVQRDQSPHREPTMSAYGKQAAVALLAAALVLWAVYRFSFGPVDSTSRLSVPAPEFFLGMEEFLGHGTTGHPAFLLGRASNDGWWYYFPVVLAVKTPLPLLILSIVGIVATIRRIRESGSERDSRGVEIALPLIGSAVVLVIAMLTRVNIGVRHILPIYPLMALLAALGALELWTRAAYRRVTRTVVALLVAIAVLIPVGAHPDHLAYFNALAGPNPDHVLVDSNLDWGQDLFRLKAAEDSIGIDTLQLAYFGSTDPRAVGLRNVRLLPAYSRTTGWVAASRTFLAGERVGAAFAWLRTYQPVEAVGPSLLLYHIER